MGNFYNSCVRVLNDFRTWRTLYFTYPKKENFKRIESIVPAALEVKKGTVIEKQVQISKQLQHLGRYVYIANNTYIGLCSRIGSFTSISFGVKIGLIEHPLDYVSTSPVFYAKRRGWLKEDTFNEGMKGAVEIGNDVLISANAVILSGVKIGDGAVVAAGAVVNKDVEPYAIVGGVPAKLISYRFDEPTRIKLQESKWWDLGESDLKELLPYFNSIPAFLNGVKRAE